MQTDFISTKFGDSPAAIRLSQIITGLKNEDSVRVSRYVTVLLSEFNSCLKKIKSSLSKDDSVLMTYLGRLAYEDFQHRIENSRLLRRNIVIKTHLLNVLKYRYKTIFGEKAI